MASIFCASGDSALNIHSTGSLSEGFDGLMVNQVVMMVGGIGASANDQSSRLNEKSSNTLNTYRTSMNILH